MKIKLQPKITEMSSRTILAGIRRFIADESGPTAVEYAVLLALILISVIGGVTAFGGASADMWDNNVTTISNAFNN